MKVFSAMAPKIVWITGWAHYGRFYYTAKAIQLPIASPMPPLCSVRMSTMQMNNRGLVMQDWLSTAEVETTPQIDRLGCQCIMCSIRSL